MGTAIALAKPIKVEAATVDTFCDLDAKRKAFAPTERSYQKLYDELKKLVANEDPAAGFTLQGERWTLEISACGFKNEPDVPTVRKRLGAAIFLLVAKITKASLEPYMLKPDIEAVCVESQSGPRTFDAIPLARDV